MKIRRGNTPVVLVREAQTLSCHDLEQHEAKTVVVWALLEANSVNGRHEFQKRFRTARLAEGTWRDLVFGQRYGLELLALRQMLHVEHAESTLDHVDEEIGERDEVVASAHRQKVHCIYAAHRHVADEFCLIL